MHSYIYTASFIRSQKTHHVWYVHTKYIYNGNYQKQDYLVHFHWKSYNSQIKWKSHHTTHIRLGEWTSYLFLKDNGTDTTEFGYVWMVFNCVFIRAKRVSNCYIPPQKKVLCSCVRLILVLVGSVKRYCCRTYDTRYVRTWYRPAEIYTYVHYVPPVDAHGWRQLHLSAVARCSDSCCIFCRFKSVL